MRVASSEIFSLMLSLRRRSTALCDSRRRRRFSFAMAALQVPEPYVTRREDRHAGARMNGRRGSRSRTEGRIRDERARKKEARRRAGSTHCFAAMSSGGVSPPFCMPTIPMPGTFTSLGLTPSPTLPRLVPPLNALKPENGKKQNNNAHSTHKALHTETARETHRAPTRAWGGRIRYPGRWA